MTFITGYFHSNHGIMFNKESNFMSFMCINDKAHFIDGSYNYISL